MKGFKLGFGTDEWIFISIERELETTIEQPHSFGLENEQHIIALSADVAPLRKINHGHHSVQQNTYLKNGPWSPFRHSIIMTYHHSKI